MCYFYNLNGADFSQVRSRNYADVVILLQGILAKKLADNTPALREANLWIIPLSGRHSP